MLEFDVLNNGTHREFRWAAVQKTNSLLKSRMHFSFSMVCGVWNTGQLSKCDRALHEPPERCTPHPFSGSSITDGCSIENRFHGSQIAQKLSSLLFIKARVIKGRKQIGGPLRLFFFKIHWL